MWLRLKMIGGWGYYVYQVCWRDVVVLIKGDWECGCCNLGIKRLKAIDDDGFD